MQTLLIRETGQHPAACDAHEERARARRLAAMAIEAETVFDHALRRVDLTQSEQFLAAIEQTDGQ